MKFPIFPALRGGQPTVPAIPPLVIAPSWFGLLPLNVNADAIAHNDILTWSLLGVLGITLGMVTACGFGIYRQFRRVTPETEIIEEIKRQALRPGPLENPQPSPPAAPANAESWERPADWWKNPPGD